MVLYGLGLVVGLAVLVWSAGKFIEGAASVAKHLGMPMLLIGVLVVGFGTSAPEMVVSAMAALEGNPALALGNAIGSNIVNIALILGLTAVIAPIVVHSGIAKKELPLLLGISLLSGLLLLDGRLGMGEGLVLLAGFFGLIGWSVVAALRGKKDTLATGVEAEIPAMALGVSVVWLALGLVLLVASSRLLVWSAVGIAEAFGVSDLIIGLTIVAFGTSLPELAASLVAVQKKEHDLAIGNVVGSNMFNILAVVGIATVLHPMESIASEVLSRDWMVMMGLTLALFVFCYGRKGRQGRINRLEGAALLGVYVGYTLLLGLSAGAL
jgi:cation:H+ antiporter